MVEGAKSVLELLRSDFHVVSIFATNSFLSGLESSGEAEVVEVSEAELGTIGEFQTNNAALAIARVKPNKLLVPAPSGLTLILDDIRDPGNLGTIVRIADWYGISGVIASPTTADFYNPKVISASMGSFARVNIFYTDLVGFLSSNQLPVFGAFLEGKSIHEVPIGAGGLIVIGNESHGIAPGLQEFITARITIPRYGGAESLNAAVATAIICDNIRRLQS